MHNGMSGPTRHLPHDPPVVSPGPLAPALASRTSQHLLCRLLPHQPLLDLACPFWAATCVLRATKALFKVYVEECRPQKCGGHTFLSFDILTGRWPQHRSWALNAFPGSSRAVMGVGYATIALPT